MANVTGWNEMMGGDVPSAVFSMYNNALVGHLMLLFFSVVIVGLLVKTKNPVIAFIVGMIMFGAFYSFFTVWDIGISSIVLIMLIAGSVYSIIWGRK